MALYVRLNLILRLKSGTSLNMNFKRHSIFFSLFKIAVLILYVPFFAVQGFFVFHNCSQYNGNYFQANYTAGTAHEHSSKIIYKNKQAEKKQQIRLNKRFHPEKALYYAGIESETRNFNLLKQSLSFYRDPLLSLFPTSTSPLRGPPNDV